MKLVRCNKCKREYYICEELDKLGFPVGTEKCDCGAVDYTILDRDVKVVYSAYKDVDNLDTINEDMRHTMAILKDELNEIIKTYLDPFLK
jgi:hypothetical protein